MNSKRLIIGKTPPPIGGVTIHVERLLYLLKSNNISFSYFELTNINWIKFFMLFVSHQRIFLQTSSIYFIFLLSLLSKLFFKNFTFILHGDLYRFKGKLQNSIIQTAIKLATQPVMLNEKSFHLASQLNKNAVLSTSFLPPDITKQSLPEEIISKLLRLRKAYNKVFSTNASNMSFDKNNQEIYGIFELINKFKNQSDLALVISDPSGTYHRTIEEKNIQISENIYLINYEHSFYKIIENTDGLIRNTTTDGDSISVREALYLKKPVYCTNVVKRPTGCVLYNQNAFEIAILKQQDDVLSNNNNSDELLQTINIYQ